MISIQHFAKAPADSPERNLTRAEWKRFEQDCRIHCMPEYRRTRYARYPSLTMIRDREVWGPAGKLP